METEKLDNVINVSGDEKFDLNIKDGKLISVELIPKEFKGEPVPVGYWMVLANPTIKVNDNTGRNIKETMKNNSSEIIGRSVGMCHCDESQLFSGMTFDQFETMVKQSAETNNLMVDIDPNNRRLLVYPKSEPSYIKIIKE